MKYGIKVNGYTIGVQICYLKNKGKNLFIEKKAEKENIYTHLIKL